MAGDKDPKSLFANMWRELVRKATHTVLNARMCWPVSTEQKRGAKWFNFDVDETDEGHRAVTALIPNSSPFSSQTQSACSSLSGSSSSPLQAIQLDIYACRDDGSSTGPTVVLLERWRFVCEWSSTQIPAHEYPEKSSELRATYKKIMILLRGLYTHLRLLPAYELYRRNLRHRNSAYKIYFELSTQNATTGNSNTSRKSGSDDSLAKNNFESRTSSSNSNVSNGTGASKNSMQTASLSSFSVGVLPSGEKVTLSFEQPARIKTFEFSSVTSSVGVISMSVLYVNTISDELMTAVELNPIMSQYFDAKTNSKRNQPITISQQTTSRGHRNSVPQSAPAGTDNYFLGDLSNRNRSLSDPESPKGLPHAGYPHFNTFNGVSSNPFANEVARSLDSKNSIDSYNSYTRHNSAPFLINPSLISHPISPPFSLLGDNSIDSQDTITTPRIDTFITERVLNLKVSPFVDAPLSRNMNINLNPNSGSSNSTKTTNSFNMSSDNSNSNTVNNNFMTPPQTFFNQYVLTSPFSDYNTTLNLHTPKSRSSQRQQPFDDEHDDALWQNLETAGAFACTEMSDGDYNDEEEELGLFVKQLQSAPPLRCFGETGPLQPKPMADFVTQFAKLQRARDEILGTTSNVTLQ